MNWMQADVFAPLDVATTPAEMRAAIEKAQQIIPVARQVMMTARIGGLSAEDTYSMLAYHALQQLQTVSRAMERLVGMGSPIPVLVEKVQAASNENGQRGSGDA